VDSDNWQRVRELFDAVCDLHPSQWRTELARMSADPAVVAGARLAGREVGQVCG